MKKTLFISIFLSHFSYAGAHCTEEISSAILHENGNVYFQTNATCPNWCQIKWSTEEDKNRAYSTLLAARTTDRKLTFYWNNLNACSEINPTYQSPEYMVY